MSSQHSEEGMYVRSPWQQHAASVSNSTSTHPERKPKIFWSNTKSWPMKPTEMTPEIHRDILLCKDAPAPEESLQPSQVRNRYLRQNGPVFRKGDGAERVI